VSAKKNPLCDKAHEMYKQGLKLVDIADTLEVPPGTVRRWKSTHNWDGERSALKSERSGKKKRVESTAIDDGTKDTLQNDELTSEQQLFCVYYSKTFNAAQSYQKAYGCTYESALCSGPRLLGNVRVRTEIERLKELKRQQIVTGTEDIVELQMRIAFADIGNYLTFSEKEYTDPETQEKKSISAVDLKESVNTDTQLIKEVKDGRYGVSIKLEDRQKAINWLTKYFLMHPESKYRAEYEKKRSEANDNSTEDILKNMQTIADILKNPVANRKIEDFEEQTNE
jgi:phage terminase small subunit